MATGGIFQIIANDGRQDRLLMATDLLRSRLESVSQQRMANGLPDATPTLLDIETTHILFMNAHFKPFAAIGFEYNKTTPQSGSSTLGSEITFSIPQFGDLFHDMVLYVKLKQPVLTLTAPDASNQPLMRWCPYPGERILEQVEFEVNGNPLDKYFDYSVNFHREIAIQPNKMLGWDRCMGQEEEEFGFFDQPTWVDNNVMPANVSTRMSVQTFSGDQTPSGQKDVSVYKELLIPLMFWCNKDVRLSVPSVAIPYGQRFIKFRLASGEKLVDMVPRGTGGWSDATIGGTLNYDNMLRSIELYINNIFVNPEIHNIFIKRIGFTLIRVHKVQTFNTTNSTDEVLLQQLKWPIEHLLIGMRPKVYNSTDNTTRRQNFDKWHRFCQFNSVARTTQGWNARRVSLKDAAFVLPVATALNNDGTATANIRLTSAAAAVADTNNFDGISVGDIVTFALTASNTAAAAVTAPVSFTLEVAQVVPDSATAAGYVMFRDLVSTISGLTGMPAGSVGINISTTVSISKQESRELSATVEVQVPTLDSASIRAHGISIFNNFMSKFYNAYMTYHYGGPNVKVPRDSGILFIPFCFYPGTYQPSGHINVSRAREFYFEFTSSVIDTNNPGLGIVQGQAINFFLICDGSAVLRYTT